VFTRLASAKAAKNLHAQPTDRTVTQDQAKVVEQERRDGDDPQGVDLAAAPGQGLTCRGVLHFWHWPNVVRGDVRAAG